MGLIRKHLDRRSCLILNAYASVGHNRLFLVSCSVSVVVIQYKISTKLPLLYRMFGLTGTGGEGDPLCSGLTYKLFFLLG